MHCPRRVFTSQSPNDDDSPYNRTADGRDSPNSSVSCWLTEMDSCSILTVLPHCCSAASLLRTVAHRRHRSHPNGSSSHTQSPPQPRTRSHAHTLTRCPCSATPTALRCAVLLSQLSYPFVSSFVVHRRCRPCSLWPPLRASILPASPALRPLASFQTAPPPQRAHLVLTMSGWVLPALCSSCCPCPPSSTLSTSSARLSTASASLSARGSQHSDSTPRVMPVL